MKLLSVTFDKCITTEYFLFNFERNLPADATVSEAMKNVL